MLMLSLHAIYYFGAYQNNCKLSSHKILIQFCERLERNPKLSKSNVQPQAECIFIELFSKISSRLKSISYEHSDFN